MDYNIMYRQKDKGWQYIISYKQDGKWKQKSKQGFRTRALAKKAADDRLDVLKNDFEADVSIENKGITFKEFTDRYISDMSRHLEMNTILACKQSVNKFFQLNDKAMEDIKFFNLQDCVNQMVDEGLKISSIKLHIVNAKVMFKVAKKPPYNIINKNPFDDANIKLPENKKEQKNKALTEFEIKDLLNKIKDNKELHLMSLLACTCGLRLGEILGLSWDVINFKKNTIKVNKQWKYTKNGYELGTVKRENSNREIPMPLIARDALELYRSNNPTDVLNRVFLIKSLPYTSKRLSDLYRKHVYDITIHDLRHTYGTSLIAKGVDFKTVAQLLGHDVEMTMKVYSHVNQDMIDNATRVVNDYFKNF